MGEKVNDQKEELRVLIENIIKSVCDVPEKASVTMQQGEQTLIFNAYCAVADMGKVIGKKGTMAQAIRKIMVAVSTKHSFRAILEINE